ncbi:hypothetical protein [Rhodovulum kholense]|uniref:Uncharacterized protein n=1 Tax=Rhodovulum kholense TaxID=453584 RepID=A0A8E2VIW1_9RHOB|nr:hypothetical protein [Rhodovulum kholense]PTW44163.1 hypothetical protein C8N38_11857 [Rhodovulum kholense]
MRRGAGLIAAAGLAGLALAESPGADPVAPLDAASLLFDWSAERCGRWDIPDAPARFWRDAEDRIHMIAGSDQSRQSLGPAADRLARVCGVVHRGGEDADPAVRNDRTWVSSIFTRDGARIEALGHMEYQGDRHPGACAAGRYMACWRNAVVALESRDGGESFARLPGPPVAALPYPYDPGQTRRSGYFTPSNIFEADGFLNVFVFAEAYGAQRRGACLLRRRVDGGPGDWRAWDGQGFSARFADPYRGAVADPDVHVCAPLPGLDATLSSVVFQPATGRFLAVSPRVGRDADGRRQAGIWGYVSRDLIHWDDPVLLVEAPLLWARDCGQGAAYAYPSLVDPDSPSPMLDRVGDHLWLTLTRMRLDADCRVGPERDLIRVHVNWPAQAGSRPELAASGPDRPDPRR